MRFLFKTSLKPAELILLFCLAITFSFYLYFGIPLRKPFELYWQRFSGAMSWYISGLCVCFFVLRLRIAGLYRLTTVFDGWQFVIIEFRKNYFNSKSLLEDLRLMNLFALFFTSYLQLKHLIPFVNSSLYDELFLQSDRLLCGNSSCAQVLIDFFGFNSAYFWSEAYNFFYIYLGLIICLFVLQRDRALVWEFALTFELVWLFGLFTVYLIPTWGPCFYISDTLPSLPWTKVAELQQQLWEMKVFIQKLPNDPRGIFLISGFPSLHIGAVVCGTLYLFRYHFILGISSLFFLLLTFVSTIYFSWHYVLDDVGGALLAMSVFYITRSRKFSDIKAAK